MSMTFLNPEMTEPVHRCRYRIIYGDTDAGGVVYYANYLRFFEFGRTEWMRAAGLPYSGIEEKGLILPVVESHIRYKAPARYDDQLVIESSLTAIDKITCRFHYRILREAEAKPLVLGFTLHAATDRTGKLSRLPDEVVARVLEILQTGTL